ncbi:MAG: 4Fe-4S dicluster domain-containing protein [bacterium]
MTPRLLPKKDLAGFIAALAKAGEVWAPVRMPGTDACRFGPVTGAGQVRLDCLNTRLPVKELFFPQREVLFRFKAGDRGRAEEPGEVPNRVVFGVRPCDAAALELFDRVFLAGKEGEAPGFDDPYYRLRRERTAIVGLACDEPGEACFCTAVGGDPHGTRALDLLLEDAGDRWLCRPLTDRGAKLTDGLKEAGAADLAEADRRAAAARAKMTFALDIAALGAKLAGAFDHEVWNRLARPCVNCGVCTFICPTCHCFDVTDEERHGAGARIRTWDSCQFALFTRHASGHNPRPTGRDRLRNRTLHKFLYFPRRFAPEALPGAKEPPSSPGVEDAGASGGLWPPVLCVGCGRCITECPAGIDLRETLETLRDALA